MHWTFMSIATGPYSLFENLKKRGVDDPDKYVVFTSLRTHDELSGKIITELIYIHSEF